MQICSQSNLIRPAVMRSILGPVHRFQFGRSRQRSHARWACRYSAKLQANTGLGISAIALETFPKRANFSGTSRRWILRMELLNSLIGYESRLPRIRQKPWLPNCKLSVLLRERGLGEETDGQ